MKECDADVRAWWYQTNRSCRRQAAADLRARRTIRGLEWTTLRLRRIIRTADLRVVSAAALAAHVPMLLYLHHMPRDWLAGAWQVSAILVGLIIILIIFLLQAAGGQSLRSEATFRAILRRTYVMWPVFFSLAFIIGVAIAERFAVAGHPAPSLVETYSLAVFVFQILLFGAVIARAIGVVSPQGVSKTLSGQFRDGVYRAVERDLEDRLATDIALNACRRTNVSFGSFLARGWPISPRHPGWVRDLDVNLPRRLNSFGVSAAVTITAQSGERTGPESPLARSEAQPASWLVREVRSGIRVTRRKPPEAPLDVFSDTVDLARRALLDGSEMAHELAVDLISDCAVVFDDAYGLYGIQY